MGITTASHLESFSGTALSQGKPGTKDSKLREVWSNRTVRQKQLQKALFTSHRLHGVGHKLIKGILLSAGRKITCSLHSLADWKCQRFSVYRHGGISAENMQEHEEHGRMGTELSDFHETRQV